MIKKLTITKCLCGSPSCKTWGFKEGMFYQGSGFDFEDAKEIARRFNNYHKKRSGNMQIYNVKEKKKK